MAGAEWGGAATAARCEEARLCRKGFSGVIKGWSKEQRSLRMQRQEPTVAGAARCIMVPPPNPGVEDGTARPQNPAAAGDRTAKEIIK